MLRKGGDSCFVCDTKVLTLVLLTRAAQHYQAGIHPMLFSCLFLNAGFVAPGFSHKRTIEPCWCHACQRMARACCVKCAYQASALVHVCQQVALAAVEDGEGQCAVVVLQHADVVVAPRQLRHRSHVEATGLPCTPRAPICQSGMECVAEKECLIIRAGDTECAINYIKLLLLLLLLSSLKSVFHHHD